MWPRQFSIRQRLWALAWVTVSAVCAVAGVGVMAVLQDRAVASDFAGRDLAALTPAGELRDAPSRRARGETELIVSFESAPLAGAARADWDAAWAIDQSGAQVCLTDDDAAVAASTGRVVHGSVRAALNAARVEGAAAAFDALHRQTGAQHGMVGDFEMARIVQPGPDKFGQTAKPAGRPWMPGWDTMVCEVTGKVLPDVLTGKRRAAEAPAGCVAPLESMVAANWRPVSESSTHNGGAGSPWSSCVPT